MTANFLLIRILVAANYKYLVNFPFKQKMKYEILREVCGLLESCKWWAFHYLPFHRKNDKISVRIFYELHSASYALYFQIKTIQCIEW